MGDDGKVSCGKTESHEQHQYPDPERNPQGLAGGAALVCPGVDNLKKAIALLEQWQDAWGALGNYGEAECARRCNRAFNDVAEFLSVVSP
jgi:hypothetical protein